jgi:RNA polymerase sigma-70 factor (sigma-E family)
MRDQHRVADAEYQEFAAGQARQLFRIAYLMCGDWHAAEDLVQITMAKLFVSWARVRRSENATAYARSVLVNSYLSQRRLRRSAEMPVAQVAEPGVRDRDVELRLTLLAALRELPPRSRAVVVLRHVEDLSIEAVASYLNASPAAVKALNARGLAQLRERLGADLPALGH